jgi:O-acetylserine/cysteine efflux transporter
MPITIPLRHLMLALAVTFVWGTNFVVIKYALHVLPPLLFAALRFTLVVFPAIFFLKRPAVPWRLLAAYGILIGAGQFGLLFLAIKSQISPGLASLVVQTQVFFTIGLAMYFTGERLKLFQGAALLLAVIGLGIIFAHTDGTTTPLGVAMILAAGLSWAGGNHIAKLSGKVNMLGYVVWSGLFSILPLFILSVSFEGPRIMQSSIAKADLLTWFGVMWQAVGNSLFGYAAWGWLLARYPATTITPLAFLIPIFGMGSAVLFLHEPMPLWKIMAALFVLAGMAVNIFWPTVQTKIKINL